MSIMSDDDFARLFQRTFHLTEDGWAGRDSEAKLAGITVSAVPASGISDDYPLKEMREHPLSTLSRSWERPLSERSTARAW